eukprot:TRINITY_DN1515_c0_g1_i2.p1 TRINITY_DN1515_c0_g1~~TRINITY_DN1515_c0_g1_i2.p1  ORF type:complete len:224 (-),score=86.45 TRINITY_DN1515_c0_g1_i2:66-737(-)
MNLFGRKKPAGPKITDSISQLREAMDTLEKREAHLQKQADEALVKAKAKSKKGDKKGALFELKRKKMFEKQIEGMFGKRVNLETQIMALQSAAANQDVLKAMKTGRDAIQAHISDKVVDEVADVMDQINENVSLIDEMDQALSQPVGPNILDDDELENELNDLEESMLTDELNSDKLSIDPIKPVAKQVKPNAIADLPSAPSSKPVAAQEDDELAALEAELAI